jgi:hypothetical protein
MVAGTDTETLSHHVTNATRKSRELIQPTISGSFTGKDCFLNLSLPTVKVRYDPCRTANWLPKSERTLTRR